MNYFTKDWCREMQVTSFLAFPETKEEWDNNLEHFKTMGGILMNLIESTRNTLQPAATLICSNAG